MSFIKKCKSQDTLDALFLVRKSKQFSVRLGRQKKMYNLPFTVVNNDGSFSINTNVKTMVFQGPSKAKKIYFYIKKRKLFELCVDFIPNNKIKKGETLTVYLPTVLLQLH